jgi:deazaflavin-dependent oxidoreductase (nitroreductase family)
MTKAPPRTRLRFLRPFTTYLFNPISRRVVGHLPGFAVLRYSGRRSGKEYRTPMNVFRHGEDYVFALTYGADVQWVKNVLAAGGCEMETRGRRIRVRDPRVVTDPSGRLVPLPIRLFMRALRVTHYLLMRPVAPGGEQPVRG